MISKEGHLRIDLLSQALSLFWAREYRVLGDKRYTILPNYPYLKEIYEQFTNEKNRKKVVIQKGAQTGLTETAINVSLWFLDACGDVLYTLPTSGDASDFSAGRLNPTIEESSYIDKLFIDVSNVGHKRARQKNYYIRGTQSKSKLKSIPIDFVVLDEVDEMHQENITLIRDRLDASPYKWEMWLSTPTYPGFGINREYEKSDQRRWFINCNECSTSQVLDFFVNVKDSKFVCKECGAELDKTNGKWKATNPDGRFPGFLLSQMISPTVTAEELTNQYKDTKGNASALENFYNSKLGLPYVAEGDKLEKEHINKLIKGYMPDDIKNSKRRAIGIDVGSELHYIISEPMNNGKKRVIKIGKAINFSKLRQEIYNYNVKVGVIDSKPETREARNLAESVEGDCELYLCNYRDGYKEGIKFNKDKKWVSVDRTESLDTSLGRFYQDNIELPQDTSEEFKEHLTALVRVIEKNKRNGTQIARYKNNGADHYAHANNYNEMALGQLEQTDSGILNAFLKG